MIWHKDLIQVSQIPSGCGGVPRQQAIPAPMIGLHPWIPNALFQCYLVYNESVWTPTFDFFMYLLETQPCHFRTHQAASLGQIRRLAHNSKLPCQWGQKRPEWTKPASRQSPGEPQPYPCLFQQAQRLTSYAVTKRNIGFQKMSVHVTIPLWQFEPVSFGGCFTKASLYLSLNWKKEIHCVPKALWVAGLGLECTMCSHHRPTFYRQKAENTTKGANLPDDPAQLRTGDTKK